MALLRQSDCRGASTTDGARCFNWLPWLAFDFVAGASSGGTAASITRYLRKWADLDGRNCPARLVVIDPEDSMLFDWYLTGNDTLSIPTGSCIEGIGSSGPVVFGKTFSLLREDIAQMIKVPDSASLAGMQLVTELVGFEAAPPPGPISAARCG